MQLILKPQQQPTSTRSLQFSFWILERLARRVEHVWDYVEEVRIEEAPDGKRACHVVLKNPREGHTYISLSNITLPPREEDEVAELFERMLRVLGKADEAAAIISEEVLANLRT